MVYYRDVAIINLPTMTRHITNGSPENRSGQVQIGLWFTTWHWAFSPQVPGQGSMHFWLTQALFRGHSKLDTHSGLQEGGAPIKPGTQEHTACPLMSLHWLFDPQGDGLHGFDGGGGAIRRKKLVNPKNVKIPVEIKLLKATFNRNYQCWDFT